MALAACKLSAEEVHRCARRLQENFLRVHSGNMDMDPRDIATVRNSISYVEKFARHNKGDMDAALHHMVECLTWRKEFGVNDIKYEDIDESLWKTGMAMNRGFDINGHNVVILNISKHRKDSKKTPMLHKWIVFCYEMHQKVYPKNRMCMIFDMAGAGLSNMDMELVRFIINCFKIYFPDLLEWLLVYNMPWVLQAAWKIVQSWMSEGGVAKVRFVTPENIQDYIPADNLLKKFGGNDPWEYVYEVEKKIMLKQIREVAGETQPKATPAVTNHDHWSDDDDMRDILEEDETEDQDGDSGDGAQSVPSIGPEEESLKQVRFSSGLPPSRQSRYGADDEEFYSISVASPEQASLKKGSATASGFRRRQVTKLMSLQESPRGGIPATRDKEMNGSLPVSRSPRRSVDMAEGVTTVGDVLLSPAHELVFSGKKDSDALCTLTLKNLSDYTVAYKIKTTAPTRYKVRPNLALIDSKSIAKVQVMLSGSDIKPLQDKFLVQTHTFGSQQSVPQMSQLTSYWKSLPSSAIREHRMRCRLVSQNPDSPAHQKAAAQNQNLGAARGTKLASKGLVLNEVELANPGENLEQKVQKLLVAHTKLSTNMTRLQRLNYFIIVLLLVLLITVYFY